MQFITIIRTLLFFIYYVLSTAQFDLYVMFLDPSPITSLVLFKKCASMYYKIIYETYI